MISFSYIICSFGDSGVSSFNEFIHELSVDSDTSSSVNYISGEEDNEEDMFPASPMSHASRLSCASSFKRYDRRILRVIKYLLSWVLWTAIVFLRIPIVVCQLVGFRRNEAGANHSSSSKQLSGPHSALQSPRIKDHIMQRTTDRRRGVIEVS